MARSASLVFLLSVFGSVLPGFIDPQILQLLRAAESSPIYVVSPFHLVPSSFLQYGFGQAVVAPAPATNDIRSTSVTEDAVRVDSARPRGLTPPKDNSNSASSGEIAPGRGRITGTSASLSQPSAEKEYLPPKNDYLPPTDAPKKEEVKSPDEYLPPKSDYLPPKHVYGPPSTAAPIQVQPPPLIFKSYVEPGFSFGEYPLNLVPIQQEAEVEAQTVAPAKGGYS